MATFKCETCKKEVKRPSKGRKDKRRFCSRDCSNLGAKAAELGMNLTKYSADNDELAVSERAESSELSLIKAQNRRLLDKVAIADRVVDYMKERALTLVPSSVPKISKVPAGTSEEEALLLLTDHHIGSKFTKEEMGGLNFYNVDEYSRRLKYCVDKTIRLTKKRPDVRVNRLVVFLGGDMVDGIIHDSLERNQDIQTADQVIVGAHLLAQAIRELAANFPMITVACAPGNHGRLRKPHEFESITQNFDTLLYSLVREKLADQKNVTFSIPREFWNYQVIGGHGHLLLHGHVGIKGFTGNATFPGYGLRKSVDNLEYILQKLGKPVEFVSLGHYHSFFQNSHNSGMITINGSIMGPNPYGVANGYPYRPACQVLQLFNKKHGLASQHLLTPTDHGIVGVPYKWTREAFDQ